VDDVARRIEIVRARLAAAVAQSGRSPGSVRLVAVSKTKPPSALRAAYAAGQRDFGENYVQELVQKAAALADLTDIRFHFIGHLQRNKAKLVARLACSVHTVDSPRLAVELGRRASEAEARGERRLPEGCRGLLDALVEVNVGGEAQKTGCAAEDVPAVCAAIEAQPGLRLAGLMTVPPFTNAPEAARPWFETLARLRAQLGGVERLPELSMGMTADLEVAVAAGATIVRVGTAIFDERK
jgi:pyridoxal phosphate enzyme (YggS family)